MVQPAPQTVGNVPFDFYIMNDVTDAGASVRVHMRQIECLDYRICLLMRAQLCLLSVGLDSSGWLVTRCDAVGRRERALPFNVGKGRPKSN